MDVSIDILRSERSFIDACVAREEWALKELYERFYPTLMPVCLRYAKDEHEAKDLLHEGFIKAFRYIDKYNPGTSLEAWMRRVMVNNCIDHYRKQHKYKVQDLDTAYNLKNGDASVLEDLSANEIVKAIQNLPSTYRSVFNMYIVEGFNHKEIAEKLQISESTSRSNLVKARKKLQEVLMKIGGV